MKKSIKAGVILATTLVVGLLPIAVAQTAASDDPTVTGPFKQFVNKCAKADASHPSAGVVGNIRSCSYLYQFDPASDGDSSRDYAAVWFQVLATTTRNGWCLSHGDSIITPPQETETAAVGPRTTVSPNSPRRFVSKMTLNTAGATGRIKQAFKLYPGTLKGRLLNGKNHLIRWDGGTDNKVMLAHGMAVSYSQANPPKNFKFGIEPSFRFTDEC